MKISKTTTFDCAHMLSGHDSLCANLHGHTYKIQVTVEGDLIKEVGSDQTMLMDFKELKGAIEACIAPFDHAMIFSAYPFQGAAEAALYETVSKHELKCVVLPDMRSTAEMMAMHFKKTIFNYLIYTLKQYNIKNISILLWETPNSCVEA